MSTPNGYIQTRYPAPKSAVDFIARMLEDFGPETSHFFKHVLVSSSLNKEPHRWIPVCAELIRAELRGANPLALVDAGLMQKRPYDRQKSLSRRWRIPDGLYNAFCRQLFEGADGPQHDLFRESRTEWTFSSEKCDENDNKHPELLRDVVEVLTTGYVNKAAVEDHLRGYEKRIDELKEEIDNASPGTLGHKQKEHRLQTVRSRRNSDLMCWNTVLNQNPEQTTGSVYRYDLAYKPQKTGRLTQIGGGLQNASGEMKAKAYSGIDNLHNYDIKASQASIFREFLAEAGLDTSFLDDYMSDPEGKHTYSEEVGLDPGTWKSALYAICIGAYVPENINESNGDLSVLFEQYLKQEDGEVDPEKCQRLYDRFRDLTSSFLKQVEKWREHLLNQWIPEHQYPGGGKHWVKNDVGCTFKVPTDPPDRSWVPSLIAFRLQGREAYFIHTLTLEAYRCGVETISNEHDGLVTIGDIPDSVVDEVRRETGMEYVKLPEKSFT